MRLKEVTQDRAAIRLETTVVEFFMCNLNCNVQCCAVAIFRFCIPKMRNGVSISSFYCQFHGDASVR